MGVCISLNITKRRLHYFYQELEGECSQISRIDDVNFGS